MKDRIKEIRKDKNMTQEAFGAVVGVTQNSIARIENGSRTPSGPVLKAICREFGVSQAWLEEGIEPKYIQQDESDWVIITRAMEGTSEKKKELMRYIATMPDELLDALFDHWESRHKI